MHQNSNLMFMLNPLHYNHTTIHLIITNFKLLVIVSSSPLTSYVHT